ncbi:hypothetical protein [Erwinia oleae]|uniref:hypothetical protein n=1 Tax=Erwinia oleae TaxID=796334 RepID=UPI000B199744|nr:hypothetical protein [Erwinia oleae]
MVFEAEAATQKILKLPGNLQRAAARLPFLRFTPRSALFITAGSVKMPAIDD